MYKKAGIIVGGLIIIVGIVIFIIASGASKPKVDSGTSSTTPSAPVVQSQQTQTQPTPQVQSTPVTVAPVTSDPVIESQPTQPVQQPTQGTVLTEISSSSLPKYTDATDVGTVVGRKIYFYNNQIVYSILINTTTHGQIEYFNNLTNYNLADGTRLNCEIRTFNYSEGSYPSIIKITRLQ